MGCGIARFGRKGLKPPKLENFGLKFCPQGFRGAAHLGFRGTAPWGFEGRRRGFEGRRHGVSRGGATDKRLQ